MEHEFDSQTPSPLPRNQASRRRHRRESLWQIGLPLTLGILLLGGGLAWLLGSGTGDAGSLAQIATMFLAIIGLTFGLLGLVLLLVGVYALARLMNWLPPQAFRLQRGIRKVNQRVIQASNLVVRPVLALDSWQKAAEHIFNRRG